MNLNWTDHDSGWKPSIGDQPVNPAPSEPSEPPS